MKKYLTIVFLTLVLILGNKVFGQASKSLDKDESTTKLFKNRDMLEVKLSYLNKDIKKETNDSTYLETDIYYKTNDGDWKNFGVQLRGRGNFRRENCYFPPIKMKISKSERKGTVFKGNKKLKLVLPCSSHKGNNDYIVKEYMAYRLYEKISPYHFNTRLIDISFEEKKGKNPKNYRLKGFLIEDIKKVAKRYDAKIVKANIHPLNHENITSVQNAFFQFMIGNTDFSTANSHNVKLLYVGNKTLPVPYDFDMSGLVNASYAHVASINNVSLPIKSVTERLYRGFERDPIIIQQVRMQFQDNKTEMLNVMDEIKPYFDNMGSFNEAKVFILDFFEIMNNDERFEKEIISHLRTK